MSRHRRRPTLRRHVRRAVTRACALTVVLATAVVGAGTAGPGTHAQPSTGSSYEVGTPVQGRDARLMQRYDCSVTGHDDGETLSAIVRWGGRSRVVTFERGWAVHVAREEAELIALCLAPPPGGRTTP